MSYPNNVIIFGHKLDIEVSKERFGSVTPEGQALNGDVLGYFLPTHAKIRVFHTDACPELGQATLIHEFIEAANQYGDLQLNHTQISTLASSLHQAFHSGGYSYATAA